PPARGGGALRDAARVGAAQRRGLREAAPDLSVHRPADPGRGGSGGGRGGDRTEGAGETARHGGKPQEGGAGVSRGAAMIAAVAPHGLTDDVLERILEAATARARAALTARRFLDFEGPLGGGIESLQVGPVHDTKLGDTGAKIASRRAVPIPTLYSTFEMPRREIEGAIHPGLPLDTSPAEDAAEEVALA